MPIYKCKDCKSTVSLNDNYCPSCGSKFLNDAGKWSGFKDTIDGDDVGELGNGRMLYIKIGETKANLDILKKNSDKFKNVESVTIFLEDDTEFDLTPFRNTKCDWVEFRVQSGIKKFKKEYLKGIKPKLRGLSLDRFNGNIDLGIPNVTVEHFWLYVPETELKDIKGFPKVTKEVNLYIKSPDVSKEVIDSLPNCMYSVYVKGNSLRITASKSDLYDKLQERLHQNYEDNEDSYDEPEPIPPASVEVSIDEDQFRISYDYVADEGMDFPDDKLSRDLATLLYKLEKAKCFSYDTTYRNDRANDYDDDDTEMWYCNHVFTGTYTGSNASKDEETLNNMFKKFNSNKSKIETLIKSISVQD